MKTMAFYTKHLKQHVCCVLLPLTVMVVLLQTPASATVKPADHHTDTIVVSKSQTSKKYKVKIYPSASNEVLFFTASGEAGKVYQLYVFDMEGKLVKQTQIKNKETTLLANFIKGSYTFDVFSDDERIENGTMQVR
jgi:hypothetical protein